MLDHLLAVRTVLIAFLCLEISAQSCDHIHIQAGDIIVVVMNLLILLVVLRFQLNDCLVLLGFDLGDLKKNLKISALRLASISSRKRVIFALYFS